MIVLWPGVTPVGERTEAPILIEDIFPTFLEMAGVARPEEATIDGHSFVPVLENHQVVASLQSRPLIWHYPNLYDQPPYSSIRLGDWKLIYWHSSQMFELYNLRADLGETTNLAQQQPKQLRTLAAILAQNLRRFQADMPIEKTTGRPVPSPDQVVPGAKVSPGEARAYSSPEHGRP
jgi:arylsulfatase A-like enzyme